MGGHVHTAIFEMDNQQGPTVSHRELCSMCGSLDGRGVWGRMDTCIWMAESLHCSPETITTLLIGYTLIQNKKLKIKTRQNAITMKRITDKEQWEHRLGNIIWSNLGSSECIKKQRHTLLIKVCVVKAMIFPVVTYGCQSWTIKKACFWIVLLEKTLESPLESKEIKPVNPKRNQPWILIKRTDAEAEAPIVWPPDVKSQLIEKDPDAGKDWRQGRCFVLFCSCRKRGGRYYHW